VCILESGSPSDVYSQSRTKRIIAVVSRARTLEVVNGEVDEAELSRTL
jgi:hypothetical protein